MDGSLIVANWMAQFPGSNSQFGAEIAYRNSPVCRRISTCQKSHAGWSNSPADSICGEVQFPSNVGFWSQKRDLQRISLRFRLDRHSYLVLTESAHANQPRTFGDMKPQRIWHSWYPRRYALADLPRGIPILRNQSLPR